ncbi:MAG: WYL domain-containing protein [Bryobacteraceae bacterium]
MRAERLLSILLLLENGRRITARELAERLKLEASLPAAFREQAELARRRILIDSRGWRDPAESIPCLPVLLDAVWRGKQVRFLYARDLCEPAEQIGHPLGLVAKGSTWYLVGNVEAETRTYRVSRIREAPALERAADIRPILTSLPIGSARRRSSAKNSRVITQHSSRTPPRCAGCDIAAGA